jgi:hypothetical protein
MIYTWVELEIIMRYCTFLKITVDVHRFKGFGLCSIPMVDDATVDKAIVAAVDVAVELAIELAFWAEGCVQV